MKMKVILTLKTGKEIELTEEEYKELERKFTKIEIVPSIAEPYPAPWRPYVPWSTPQTWVTTSTVEKPQGPPNEVIKETIF